MNDVDPRHGSPMFWPDCPIIPPTKSLMESVTAKGLFNSERKLRYGKLAAEGPTGRLRTVERAIEQPDFKLSFA
jgi:hypothetical protein